MTLLMKKALNQYNFLMYIKTGEQKYLRMIQTGLSQL